MFVLPKLPYDYNALAPYISEQIQQLHHNKHHQTYVDNLNKAFEKYPEWAEKPIEDIIVSLDQVPEEVRTAVKNNGGGHFNHSMFWEMMAPAKGQTPNGELLQKIESAYGGLDEFKKQFAEGATKIFGSGWMWLVAEEGELDLVHTPNQDSPLTFGKTPLLGLDVWEHAYYLQYYNKRADYIEAWWNIVNWEEVMRRYDEVAKA